MNKKTRFWVRRVVMLTLIVLIGYALWQGLDTDKKKAPEVGDKAPNFTLKTLDGKKLTLDDFHGKPVLLNFWASWCKPCEAEMPAIQKVYEKYKDQGFQVVGVNIAETEVAVSGFTRELAITFPVVLDRDRVVTKRYDVGRLPATYLIDRNGKIIRKMKGQMLEEEVDGYAKEALSK
ncbi:thiol-disulfide oxidoreductase ResA [Marininema halotolerans]|uniref:Peroxiredoxin n=1 Tax=Marininema halotolerans TaxID=1155944 RepID=A0A1I6QB03_9BACL|nr:thiol-disulfide oxidoreductase ResA [Marininema halotolerans]SFS49639.1 Peroxiredoxin [Marininema halotolerans]